MQQSTSSNSNRLWIARKRNGLGQKTVARLLGHKTLSVVSEYENGRIMPNLHTGLKLSAIYRTPLTELYAPLYSQIERQIEAERRKLPAVSRNDAVAEVSHVSFHA